MNDQSWMNELQWQDVLVPPEEVIDEEIYTLTMADFLHMPDVNFADLVRLDPQVKALLN